MYYIEILIGNGKTVIKDNDRIILKEMNKAIKGYRVKLKFQYYNESPFSEKDKAVIPIIIRYSDELKSYKNRLVILSALGVQGFDEAVPYLVEQYKIFNLEIYSAPFDDLLLLDLCNTIAKIGSRDYINLYIEMLKLPPMAALESIIKMLGNFKIDEVDEHIFALIERENKIPEAWIGLLNETDKYWCSQKAFEYIIKKKRPEYRQFIEKFLTPEKLPWIQFAESSFQKQNYSHCYKKYIDIAKRGLKYLE